MAPAAGAGSDGRSALCESSASPGLCRGIDVLIDGPWIYKDMSLAYRTGGGDRVRWRVLPKAHQTVAIDFSVSTSTDRFQTFRQLDIYLPSMLFRKLPRTAFQGSGQPRVTVDGDHLLWRATPLSRVGRGGFSHEFLAITLPTGKTQVCPRLVATFTDRVLTYTPACWRIRST
jgi:hypothetical protein